MIKSIVFGILMGSIFVVSVKSNLILGIIQVVLIGF